MYVWRIPFFAAVAIAISVVVLVVCAALFHLRSRVRSHIARGVCLAGAVLSVLACPVLFVVTTEPVFTAARAHGRYIDQGVELGCASALLVVFVLAGCRFLFPERDRVTTFGWRATFAVLVVAFAAMNVANWCSPGWCERFGFPFSYSWWSDAIVVLNGKNLSAGTSVIAVAANSVILLLAAATLSASYRHASAQAAPPSNSA